MTVSTRRALLLATATVALAVAAVALLLAGVRYRETTGGLLVTPFRQVELIGGYLLAGTAAGVAAVLCGLGAVPALWSARRRRTAPSGPPPPVPEVVPDPGDVDADRPAPPELDRRR